MTIKAGGKARIPDKRYRADQAELLFVSGAGWQKCFHQISGQGISVRKIDGIDAAVQSDAGRTEGHAVMTARDTAEQTVRRLRALGFRYVTLDLQGFRSGSMDE